MIPAFYINLDSRTDRREQIEKECANMGIDAERFSALRSIGPSQGCTLSHIEVLRLARERGYPAVLVLEDDFQWLVSKEQLVGILETLPADYDVVMLAYYLLQSEPYNDSFGRVLEAQNAAGYIVSAKFYDTLIQTLEEGYNEFLKQPDIHWLYINDQYWKRLQPISRWYYTVTLVGRQRMSYSDLARMVVNCDS